MRLDFVHGHGIAGEDGFHLACDDGNVLRKSSSMPLEVDKEQHTNLNNRDVLQNCLDAGFIERWDTLRTIYVQLLSKTRHSAIPAFEGSEAATTGTAEEEALPSPSTNASTTWPSSSLIIPRWNQDKNSLESIPGTCDSSSLPIKTESLVSSTAQRVSLLHQPPFTDCEHECGTTDAHAILYDNSLASSVDSPRSLQRLELTSPFHSLNNDGSHNSVVNCLKRSDANSFRLPRAAKSCCSQEPVISENRGFFSSSRHQGWEHIDHAAFSSLSDGECETRNKPYRKTTRISRLERFPFIRAWSADTLQHRVNVNSMYKTEVHFHRCASTSSEIPMVHVYKKADSCYVTDQQDPQHAVGASIDTSDETPLTSDVLQKKNALDEAEMTEEVLRAIPRTASGKLLSYGSIGHAGGTCKGHYSHGMKKRLRLSKKRRAELKQVLQVITMTSVTPACTMQAAKESETSNGTQQDTIVSELSPTLRSSNSALGSPKVDALVTLSRRKSEDEALQLQEQSGFYDQWEDVSVNSTTTTAQLRHELPERLLNTTPNVGKSDRLKTVRNRSRRACQTARGLSTQAALQRGAVSAVPNATSFNTTKLSQSHLFIGNEQQDHGYTSTPRSTASTVTNHHQRPAGLSTTFPTVSATAGTSKDQHLTAHVPLRQLPPQGDLHDLHNTASSVTQLPVINTSTVQSCFSLYPQNGCIVSVGYIPQSVEPGSVVLLTSSRMLFSALPGVRDTYKPLEQLSAQAFPDQQMRFPTQPNMYSSLTRPLHTETFPGISNVYNRQCTPSGSVNALFPAHAAFRSYSPNWLNPCFLEGQH